MKRWMPFLLLLVSLASWGCGPSLLETEDFGNPKSFRLSDDLELRDTEENRAILDRVEVYRDAMERRDGEAIRALVGTGYYENASSTDDLNDDYGNEAIDELTSDYLDAVEEIRYQIEVLDFYREGAKIYVEYLYVWNFRFLRGGKEHWESSRDVNQLTFVEEDGEWKIVAGL